MESRNRKMVRIQNWNYSKPASYFITINVKNRQPLFGEIRDKKFIPNALGMICQNFWLDIPYHFENMSLGIFQIMPDHFHGVINIHGSAIRGNRDIDERQRMDFGGNRHACSLLQPQYARLPVIIGSFKSAVSKEINQKFPETNFQWQKSYFDIIIISPRHHAKIQKYIINNPSTA